MEKKFTNIENKFKSELADYGDWGGDEGAIWGAIENSLDGKKRRKALVWWWFGGMLCLAVLGVSLWNIEPVSTHIVTNSKANEQLNGANLNAKVIDNQNNTIEIVSQESTLSENKNIQTKEASKTHFTKKNILQTTKRAPQKKLTNGVGLIIPTPPSSTENVNYSSKSNAMLKAKAVSFQTTNLLDYRTENLDYPDTLDTPCVVVNVVEEPSYQAKESLFSIGYYRGINHHTNGFHAGQPENALRKATEKGQFGKEEGLHFEFKLKNDYLFATGLSLTKYWERFDFSEETAIQVFEDNVVVRYNINSITMDTAFIIGDQWINGIEVRDIRHHNSWSMLRVPLLLGKEWTSERSSFKLLGGVSLETRIAQETKDSTNDFELFKQSTSTASYRRFGMNLEVMPAFDYRISPKFTATLSMPIRYAMTSWDYRDRTDLSFAQKRPLMYSMNIGLNYEW